MRRLMTLLIAFVAALSSASQAHAEKRVALVIGNADYASLSDLRNPANDARDMAATLQGLGFALVGGKPQLNLTRRDMLRAIRDFAGSLAPGDVALFYYAGHGAQHGGENYLIPVDDGDIAYREDLPDSAVGADAVRRQLETAGAVTALLFLDACRNTPLPARAGGRTASRGLARMQEIPGSYIAFAAAPGQEAADGAGRNGLFTAALLKALGKPERRIEDIFMETAAEVARQSSRQQQPWSSSSLEKPFYFKGDGGRDGPPVDHAALAFQALTGSNDPAEFETFAGAFPASPLAVVAAQRAQSLRGRQAALTAPGALPQSKSSQPTILERITMMSVKEIQQDKDLRSFALAGGRAVFNENCVVCHGPGGQGGKGYPNLTDDAWLWGGKISEIYKTIADGVRDAALETTHGTPGVGAMTGFGADGILNKIEIDQVTDYLLWLNGKTANAAKAAIGKRIFEENCSACHGPNAEGSVASGLDGIGAPPLKTANWIWGGDKASLMATVTNGRVGEMPAWSPRLPDAAIKQLAIYVHSLGGGT